MPFQRRLTPTEKPSLIGFDLYENPISHPGVANQGLYGCYFHPDLIRCFCVSREINGRCHRNVTLQIQQNAYVNKRQG
jgi:hypothetical protein